MSPMPEKETERLSTLKGYAILDTHPEDRFDDLTKLAASICRTPIALVSLIDADRQWFKSKVGLKRTQTPHEDAFCAHAILSRDVMVVRDASRDPRFADNPLVLGKPHIRLYAGAPLTAPNGHNLGALCVIDRKPRRLNRNQLEALRILSREVMAQVTLGKHLQDLQAALKAREEFESAQQKLIEDLREARAKINTLEAMIPMCAWCKKVRNDRGYWEQVESYIAKFTGVYTTSSICPECVEKHFGNLPQPEGDLGERQKPPH